MIICAIKCKVHSFCLTTFFCKFVIKVNPSKWDFSVIYAIFPNLTLSLATQRRIPKQPITKFNVFTYLLCYPFIRSPFIQYKWHYSFHIMSPSNLVLKKYVISIATNLAPQQPNYTRDFFCKFILISLMFS